MPRPTGGFAYLLAQDAATLDEAVSLAAEAVELEPDKVGYWVDLGRWLLEDGRDAEARVAGRRALVAARDPATRRFVMSSFSSLNPEVNPVLSSK